MRTHTIRRESLSLPPYEAPQGRSILAGIGAVGQAHGIEDFERRPDDLWTDALPMQDADDMACSGPDARKRRLLR
jgi:hypothetical protein